MIFVCEGAELGDRSRVRMRKRIWSIVQVRECSTVIHRDDSGCLRLGVGDY